MPDEVTIHLTAKGPRFTVLLGTLTDGVKRIPIAILGKFQKGAQKFAITRQTLADLVANFKRRTIDTVIDYEHASEFPELAQGGPIPAAGWLTAVDDAPDAAGILWGTAKFTARAAAMIAAEEYRFISPVINYGARDKHTGEAQGATLESAALTNRPFLEGLPAIAMTDWRFASEAQRIDRSDAVDKHNTRRKKTMRVIMADRVARTVRLVDDDGTERTVAVEGLEPPQNPAHAKRVILADRAARTVRVVNDDGVETTLAVEGLEAPIKIIRLSDVGRLADGRFDFPGIKLEGEPLIGVDVWHALQTEQEINAAVAAGKILPAQRAHYEKLALTDLASFRDLVKTLPKQVELREVGVGGDGREQLDVKVLLTSIETEIAEKRKANPKLDYGSAWQLVAREKPDLIKSYNAAAKAASKTEVK